MLKFKFDVWSGSLMVKFELELEVASLKVRVWSWNLMFKFEFEGEN